MEGLEVNAFRGCIAYNKLGENRGGIATGELGGSGNVRRTLTESQGLNGKDVHIILVANRSPRRRNNRLADATSAVYTYLPLVVGDIIKNDVSHKKCS